MFIDSGAPHCGTSSYAGFTCPAGQDICNPLIFGVHDDGRPVCHPTATTNWCYKNTKPGYTTRLDLVYEKAGSAQAWANFQRDTAMICNNKNYSKVEETVDQVTRACKRIVRQTQINQSRLDRGWDGAKSLKNDKGFYALYQNDTAGSGKCVAPLKEEPLKVLKRNGMSYVGNPTGSELKALATGIRQIERLLGHPIKRNWQTTFRYVNSGGTWNYGISSSGNVTVKRRTGHGGANNISRYMHELGHKVGWSGYYDRFSNYPGTTSCKVSPYASYSRNERFAETFAAFVTYPELLKERCPSAFNFFAKEVFSNGQKSSALALCNREKPRPKGSWINKLFKKGTQ